MFASLILSILAILLAYSAKKNPTKGIMVYYAIRMVIPSSARVFAFSFNTVSLSLLIICLYPILKKKYILLSQYEKGFIKAVGRLVFSLFFLSLLASVVPKFYQWSGMFQMFGTEFVPALLLMICLSTEKECKEFNSLVILSALFYGLYSIYTYIASSNPIFDFFNNSDADVVDLLEYANGRMGLTGIAVGIYNDKIACSLIGLVLFMFIISNSLIGKNKKLILSCICATATYLSTQRAGLLCLLLFVVIMLFDKNRRNIVRRNFLVLCMGVILFFSFTDNKDVINSIYSILYLFDDKMQQRLGVGGSNMELRYFQYMNGLNYLGFTNILQGCGFSFPNYYYENIWRSDIYGLDYRFAGFESFPLKILMNSGILGMISWGVFFKRVFVSFKVNRSVSSIAFYSCYMIAIILTDTSASLYLFFMLFVLKFKGQLLKEKYG